MTAHIGHWDKVHHESNYFVFLKKNPFMVCANSKILQNNELLEKSLLWTEKLSKSVSIMEKRFFFFLKPNLGFAQFWKFTPTSIGPYFLIVIGTTQCMKLQN